MAKKTFQKIWSSVLTSLFVLPTKGVAVVNDSNYDLEINDFVIEAQEESKPDLFLKQANDLYGDSMLLTGHRSHSSHRSHRSHSSHRSHYSSRTYSSPPTYTGPSTTKPSTTYTSPKKSTITLINKPNTTNIYKKHLNTTNIKMIQITLNLLAYKAGKVDGIYGAESKSAITKFQSDLKIESQNGFNPQTCLQLALKMKERFPNDKNAKEIHEHLLRLYLKMTMPN